MEVSGQSGPRQVEFKEVKGADDNCIYKPMYTAAQRLKKYPFNKAGKVMLVSFRYHKNNYPIKNQTVMYDSLLEQKTLSAKEVTEVTDLIYNNVYKKASRIGSMSMCFFPRNAMVFLDKDGNAFETVFICFHCSRYEIDSGRWGVLADDCNQKLDLLYKFFVKQGFKYGIDKDRIGYPGETGDEEGIVSPYARSTNH